jgi:RNA polymerase sigma-70 factor (ECF subfamily)
VDNQELAKLIVQAQAGQSEAFGQIYDHFSQQLFRFVRTKVQSKEYAEDLLQETFIKAWRGLATYRPEGGSFSGWLYRIAINTVTDHYRKLDRTAQTVEIIENIDFPTNENPEKEFDAVFDSKYLRALLHKLPERYRTVLELRYLSELTVQETAEIFGKSQIAVRILQHRALKKLQSLMNNQSKNEPLSRR